MTRQMVTNFVDRWRKIFGLRDLHRQEGRPEPICSTGRKKVFMEAKEGYHSACVKTGPLLYSR